MHLKVVNENNKMILNCNTKTHFQIQKYIFKHLLEVEDYLKMHTILCITACGNISTKQRTNV